ncbi:MAG TPA: RNA 3'-phosphate cyclase [Myxococcales bacterium]|nr:RNA 3'-phosphate cyclase [Myxococcales bacterium]
MHPSPIRLDGSEGGGLALRSALGLSLVTGVPLLVESLGGQGAAGLDAPMLALVRAAQAVGGAQVEGAVPGGERLLFSPRPVRAGDYLLDLGVSGSIPEAVQMITPALALAGSSVVKLRGLTHPARGPVLTYLTMVWLPLMRELGYDLELELHAAGFEPEGGGEVSLWVRGASFGRSLDRRSRGTLREVRVLSTISNLPLQVATRQSERAIQRLKESGIPAEAENIPVPAPRSRGSLCLVIAAFERGRAGFFAVGTPGDEGGAAGERAAEACIEFIRSGAGFDASLAQQSVFPMAVAVASSISKPPVYRFSVARLTDGLLAEASVAGRLLGVEVALLAGPGPDDEAEVRVAHARESLLEALRRRES